jgi:site-specific recombinase XerD
LIEEPKPPYPYGDVLPNFLLHIRNVRGMTEKSVRNIRFRVTWFLCWAEERRKTFSDISLLDVEQYIASRHIAGHKLRTVASSCHSLRTFFRYAETKGLTQNRIANGIRVPSIPRYDPGPKGPRWKDVRKLIAACSGDNPSEQRARAILLLFAVYGFRSGEVSSLTLNDIDWYDESFLVRRAKHGGGQRFPIQFEVGEAIVKYLQSGRPKCSCRNVFVTLHPPYRPITVGSLHTLVRRRMQALAIEAPQRGPRGFRHACATQLLHKGYSLSEIADFLGHRSTTSVSIYARPSASSIRKVAAFSLGGLK